MLDFLFATLGLIILVLAGDTLVRGAVNMSLRLGVPALVVSLTIVAIGTSAPELLVGISAVTDGVPGIALGNVIGSNTANVLLVLGVPALLVGLQSSGCDTRSSYVQMIFGTFVFIALAATGLIGAMSGAVLLALFLAFMAHAAYSALKARRAGEAIDVEEELEGVEEGMSWPKILLLIGLGLIGLPFGADLLVDSASEIARDYHVPETVIGLTLVAVGTSLPELATTVSAAYRNQAEVALGNVIGSNMANTLGIVGATALVGPIPVPHMVVQFDMMIMLGASLLLIPFVFFKVNINRVWGALFTVGYVAYVLAVLF